MQDGALLFTGLDQLLTDSRRPLLDEFPRSLEQHARFVYLSGEMAWEPRDALRNAWFARVQMSRPKPRGAAELWSRPSRARWTPNNVVAHPGTGEQVSVQSWRNS